MPPIPSGSSTSKGKYLSIIRDARRAVEDLAQQQLRDPSTLPFLRAYGLGYAASTGPAILRILVRAASAKKSSKASGNPNGRHPFSQLLLDLVRTLVKGFSSRGLAIVLGISIGGAKWGESRIEPLVRKFYVAAAERAKLRRRQQGSLKTYPLTVQEQEAETAQTNRQIKIISTLVSSTLASLLSIILLQSGKGYARPKGNLGFQSIDDELPSPSPYPSFNVPISDSQSSQLADTRSSNQSKLNAIPDSIPPAYAVQQSPTLDMTLFVLVRGADILVRGLYEYTGVVSGRFGTLVTFVASQADTLVFWLSCWRIMWCWFYLPERLPGGYGRWILMLARMDPRLLRLLQYARKGEYVYGQKPNAEVEEMCAGIARSLGRPAEFVNPFYIDRLHCSAVHGKVGAGSCEVNALKRWSRAFIDCLAIYLPVHLIPPLLFNFRGILNAPLSSAIKILLAASRSSAFLATFVATIYASVCLVRTRIATGLLPNLPQQLWDSGLCTGLGCFLCGFSVLIENKRRRREMALYCAPRALYAVMDEIVPSFLTHGKTGEFLSTWIERCIFAMSTGTVITATVYRPHLVSGVVRGVMGKAVGDWGGVIPSKSKSKTIK